ncbi:MAG: hypothetical protein GC151_04785 [Betaproteobacteria bacterium]|nr:hypothetical protein [Betaproteobacteria bacterium]
METVIPDQAAGLRRLFARNSVRSVAFVSGTRGIGRSALVGDVAVALARRGQSVCVIEHGLPAAGVAARLGWGAVRDLSEVILQGRRLDDVMSTGPEGVRFVGARQAGRECASLAPRDEADLSAAFANLDPHVDMLLVDAPSGTAEDVAPSTIASSETVVVVSAARDGITDAYGLVKRLVRESGRRRFHAVVIRARGEDHARVVHQNLAETAHRFLSANIAWLGWVPDDADRMKALRLHQPVSCAFPLSGSALAVGAVADSLIHWPYAAEDCLDGFLHRFVQASRMGLSENV